MVESLTTLPMLLPLIERQQFKRTSSWSPVFSGSSKERYSEEEHQLEMDLEQSAKALLLLPIRGELPETQYHQCGMCLKKK